MRKLILFLLFYSLIFRECSASLQPIKDHLKNLPQFICDAAEEVSKQEVRTMAIVKLRHNFPSSFFDELHKCLPIDVAMVQLDLESAFVDVEVKNVKFVLVIGDDVEGAEFINLVDEQNSKRLLSHLAKFLFVSTSKHKMMKNLSKVLPKNGILDFAAAFEDENGEVNVEVSNHFTDTSKVLKNIPKTEIISQLYPNKLENMHKAPIRILAHYGMSNVLIRNDSVVAENLHFVDLVTQKLNASTQLTVIQGQGVPQIAKEVYDLYTSRQMDISLGVSFQINGASKLNTHGRNGFCALVPLPEKVSLSEIYYFYPLDFPITIVAVSALVFFMIMWWIFKRRGQARGSIWNIPYAITLIFVNQPYNFRTVSWVLRFSIHIYFFALFVMTRLYEGIVTSTLAQPSYYPHFSSIPQLFDNKHNIRVMTHAEVYVRDFEEYKRAKAAGRVTLWIGTWLEETTYNTIEITRCDAIGRVLKSQRMAGYYIFPKRIVSFYTELELGFNNPYKEELQKWMDKAVTAGLPNAWKKFYDVEAYKTFSRKKERNDFGMLTFEDMKPAFMYPLIGLISGVFMLLLEIFHHDFLARFSWQYFMRKWGWNEKKKTVIKVRRIQVRPINESESEM